MDEKRELPFLRNSNTEWVYLFVWRENEYFPSAIGTLCWTRIFSLTVCLCVFLPCWKAAMFSSHQCPQHTAEHLDYNWNSMSINVRYMCDCELMGKLWKETVMKWLFESQVLNWRWSCGKSKAVLNSSTYCEEEGWVYLGREELKRVISLFLPPVSFPTYFKFRMTLKLLEQLC